MHTTFKYTPTDGLVSIGTPLPFSALDIFVEDVGVDRKRREKGSNLYPLDLDEKMAIGGTADYKWSAISSRFPLAHISTCLWKKKGRPPTQRFENNSSRVSNAHSKLPLWPFRFYDPEIMHLYTDLLIKPYQVRAHQETPP